MHQTCLIRSPFHTQRILMKLNLQRISGIFSDIIVCIQDRTFPLHRCILAASSPKLDMMISYMKSNEKILVLHNISALGFTKAIKYMYTGRIRLSLAHAHAVLATARSLQFVRLERVCLDYFKKILHIDPDVTVTLERLNRNKSISNKKWYMLRSRNMKRIQNRVNFRRSDDSESSSDDESMDTTSEWEPDDTDDETRAPNLEDSLETASLSYSSSASSLSDSGTDIHVGENGEDTDRELDLDEYGIISTKSKVEDMCSDTDACNSVMSPQGNLTDEDLQMCTTQTAQNEARYQQNTNTKENVVNGNLVKEPFDVELQYSDNNIEDRSEIGDQDLICISKYSFNCNETEDMIAKNITTKEDIVHHEIDVIEDVHISSSNEDINKCVMETNGGSAQIDTNTESSMKVCNADDVKNSVTVFKENFSNNIFDKSDETKESSLVETKGLKETTNTYQSTFKNSKDKNGEGEMIAKYTIKTPVTMTDTNKNALQADKKGGPKTYCNQE